MITQRLFFLYSLLALGLQHVPVVRVGDEHGVDVVAGEQFVEVVVAPVGGYLGKLSGPIQMPAVHVADGRHLGGLAGHEIAHAAHGLVAGADHADVDPVRRGLLPSLKRCRASLRMILV